MYFKLPDWGEVQVESILVQLESRIPLLCDPATPRKLDQGCRRPLVNGTVLRRKIHTEEKANVVAAVWGTELRQFLAALAILHLDNLKNTVGWFGTGRVEEWGAKQPILQLVLVQNSYSGARNWSNSVPQELTTTFAFSSVQYLSFFYGTVSWDLEKYFDFIVGPTLLLFLLLLLLVVEEQAPSQRHSNMSTYVFSVTSEQLIETVESRAAVMEEVTTVLSVNIIM